MNSAFVFCTVNSCDFTVHALKKKERERSWKRECGFANVDPNAHYKIGNHYLFGSLIDPIFKTIAQIKTILFFEGAL